MGGGPDSVTNTTTNEPPEFLVGPLTNATNAAQQQFFGQSGMTPTTGVPGYTPGGGGNGGNPIPGLPFSPTGPYTPPGGNFPGRNPPGLNPFLNPNGPIDPINPVIPTNTPRTAELAMPEPQGMTGGFDNQAVNPNPVTPGAPSTGGYNPNGLMGSAQGLVGQTIQGDFLNPETNPYLASTFNRAADLTQTRLASEFAGSGRNIGASLPARSDELQTLASNIFGGNYQAERGRQQGAADQAQALDPLNLFINRLAGIIPGAGGSSQSTQPVFRQGLF